MLYFSCNLLLAATRKIQAGGDSSMQYRYIRSCASIAKRNQSYPFRIQQLLVAYYPQLGQMERTLGKTLSQEGSTGIWKLASCHRAEFLHYLQFDIAIIKLNHASRGGGLDE
jgi:hypothetical protein